MERDIRATDAYREIESLCRTLRQPGTGQISEAAEIHVSPSDRRAVFAGMIMDRLEGTPPTRICLTDLDDGDTRVLTFGPNMDRLPKFSPDGRQVAFLSDRHKAGDFQLFLLDPVQGVCRPAPRVDGWVEYLHWSADGKSILLGVAGHGADVAGGQGAVTTRQTGAEALSWMPVVETGDESFRWRRAWVYDLATDQVRQVGDPASNMWEVVWCGSGALAAVVSPGPGEGLWYSARLHLVDLESGRARELFAPREQMGWPAASPSGKYLAIVESICSDRWIVAGDLRLIETASGNVRAVDTNGVDVTHTEWRSEGKLLIAGHRGLESVVGICDAASGSFTQVWASRDVTASGRYISVSGVDETGDFALVGEGFRHAPEIAVVRKGEYRSIRSFDLGYAREARVIEAVEPVSWEANDGLEIQGWLVRPRGEGPHPLVLNVHGGPVFHWRTTWLGRWGALPLALLQRGYAIFFPNPRGSSGRGQDFIRPVYGDMGGADAQDILCGVDALIRRGIADPKRLAVMGGSYGGFMTSWLITQDARFGAAAPFAPHTNQVTEHLLSNIPHFMALLLQDKWNNAGGKYFERSPVMHAHKVRTPTLNVTGALDACTPPEEAKQFHNALLEYGVKSALVTYPEEGHGVRRFPAVIDHGARVVEWFGEHLREGRR